MSAEPFRPRPLLVVPREHGVEFIVIGGLAAIAHGSHMITQALDICYERTKANYEPLAQALRSVHATLRGAPADIPFKLDALTIQMGDCFTFSTDLGPLDCLGTPSGTDGYQDLLATAVEMPVGGITVRVTSLDDLLRMKRAAGRLKDRMAIEELSALRDELDGEPDEEWIPPKDS